MNCIDSIGKCGKHYTENKNGIIRNLKMVSWALRNLKIVFHFATNSKPF